jgi:hypothetical protein
VTGGSRRERRRATAAKHILKQKQNSLLLLPEGKETDTRNLHDLESNTWDITLGLSSSTETGNEDLVVLVGLESVPSWVYAENHQGG